MLFLFALLVAGARGIALTNVGLNNGTQAEYAIRLSTNGVTEYDLNGVIFRLQCIVNDGTAANAACGTSSANAVCLQLAGLPGDAAGWFYDTASRIRLNSGDSAFDPASPPALSVRGTSSLADAPLWGNDIDDGFIVNSGMGVYLGWDGESVALGMGLGPDPMVPNCFVQFTLRAATSDQAAFPLPVAVPPPANVTSDDSGTVGDLGSAFVPVPPEILAQFAGSSTDQNLSSVGTNTSMRQQTGCLGPVRGIGLCDEVAVQSACTQVRTPTCTGNNQGVVVATLTRCALLATAAQQAACCTTQYAAIQQHLDVQLAACGCGAQPFTCPQFVRSSGSKKGLLGLLGLLALIPCVLLLLLCCLGLLLCRRSKKGTPTHVATFDQPSAYPVSHPVAVLPTQTIHDVCPAPMQPTVY